MQSTRLSINFDQTGWKFFRKGQAMSFRTMFSEKFLFSRSKNGSKNLLFKKKTSNFVGSPNFVPQNHWHFYPISSTLVSLERLLNFLISNIFLVKIGCNVSSLECSKYTQYLKTSIFPIFRKPFFSFKNGFQIPI